MRIDKRKLVRTQRRVFILVCICLIALVSLQCNRVGDQKSTRESKVTALYPGDERIFFQEWNGMDASYLMFLPLFAHDTGGDNLEPVPVLVERWEHADDYKKWTYYIRKDVKWHDGVQFTAHDIKFTMDLRLHPDVIGRRPGGYSVDVIDDFTLTVTYKKPTDGHDT